MNINELANLTGPVVIVPFPFFARKDISWRVRKLKAKQNRFQIVTIFFFTFFQHIS